LVTNCIKFFTGSGRIMYTVHTGASGIKYCKYNSRSTVSRTADLQGRGRSFWKIYL
jgi:hypothetical protein